MTQEREPLLRRQNGRNAPAKASSSVGALPSLARTVLKFLMWAVFLTWAAGIFLFPTKPGQAVFRMCIGLVRDSVLGITGTQRVNICSASLLIFPVDGSRGEVSARIHRFCVSKVLFFKKHSTNTNAER
jgi:ferric-chelate reductase